MSKNATFYSALLFVLGFAASLFFYLSYYQVVVWQLSSLPLAIILGLISFIGTLVLFSVTKTKSRAETFTRVGMIVSNLFLMSFVIMLMISVESDINRKVLTSVGEEHVVEFYESGTSLYENPTSIYAELQGPLWFSKRIYHESFTNEINVEWSDPSTLVVNGKAIDLYGNNN